MINSSRANPARVWNYWLGGKDNYPIDQEFGEQVRTLTPAITDIARAGRGFLLRAVRHLTGVGGIRQFLDIGPGLPTSTHTHEVAQAIAPACRVVYVDHDLLVLAHARALLGILNFLAEDDQAHAIVIRLLDALPAGSYLLLSHPTAEVHPEAMLEYTRLWNEHLTFPITTRAQHLQAPGMSAGSD